MVTLNLDVRQFAQDAIRNAEESEWVWRCYERLRSLSILDPTCGSGAFLFAALKVLVPLYEECLNRMEIFLDDLKRNISADRRSRIADMKTVLDEVAKHRNRAHFITKSIIINNLYGVDLMHEAVEIAKLRLFLQLMSTLPEPVYDDPNMGLEPLPDVDFNIRAGNTLVGFVNINDVKKVARQQEPMFADEVVATIEEQLDVVAELGKAFRRLSETDDPTLPGAKRELREQLALLNDKLNEYQGKLHGKDANKHARKFEQWCAECRPFNWFAEFFDIMHRRGGFDVIIGNPPYVATGGIDYLDNYTGVACADLYGYVIERGLNLLHKKGQFGFIVMHSLAFSRGFREVRDRLRQEKGNLWFSFFSRIPSGLFSGDVRVRNCIFLLNRAALKPAATHTTRIHRWFGEKREVLLHDLEYAPFKFKSVIPMFNDAQEAALFENMQGDIVGAKTVGNSKYKAYFKQSAYNWISVAPTVAPSYLGRELTPQTKVGTLSFLTKETGEIITMLLNGRLFFAYWLVYGDEFDITQDLLKSFSLPFNKFTEDQIKTISKTHKKFIKELNDTLQFKLNAGKRVGTYNTAKLWHLTDVTDRIFLEHLTPDADKAQQVILNHVSSTLMTGRGLELEEDD